MIGPKDDQSSKHVFRPPTVRSKSSLDIAPLKGPRVDARAVDKTDLMALTTRRRKGYRQQTDLEDPGGIEGGLPVADHHDLRESRGNRNPAAAAADYLILILRRHGDFSDEVGFGRRMTTERGIETPQGCLQLIIIIGLREANSIFCVFLFSFFFFSKLLGVGNSKVQIGLHMR